MQKRVRAHGDLIDCRSDLVYTDAAIVQEEDRFRLDRLAVEQTLAQRAVFQQFKNALEHDDANMLPHKQAEEARTIFPLPVNVGFRV